MTLHNLLFLLIDARDIYYFMDFTKGSYINRDGWRATISWHQKKAWQSRK